jgi:hypothetical protein
MNTKKSTQVGHAARTAPALAPSAGRHIDQVSRPVTADAIALQAMREKGLDMGHGVLRQDMVRRILWTLNRVLPRGAVVKLGNGALAEWSQTAQNEPP